MTRIRQFLLRDEQDESQVTHHNIKGNLNAQIVLKFSILKFIFFFHFIFKEKQLNSKMQILVGLMKSVKNILKSSL